MVGTGSAGQKHLRAAERSRFCREATIISSREVANRIRTSSSAIGPDESPNQFDLIVVASPASNRVQLVRGLLPFSKSFLLEKPLATSTTASSQLMDLCREIDKRMFVGYVLRQDPICVSAKHILESGRLGTIQSATFYNFSYLPDWRPGRDFRDTVSAQAELGGGVLLEMSHELDLASWLLGHPREVLDCELGSSVELGLEVETFANLHLDGPKGESIQFQLDMGSKATRRGFRIEGDEGAVFANLLTGECLVRLRDGSEEVEYLAPIESQVLFDRQLDLIGELISTGGDTNSLCSLQEAANTVRIIDGCRTFS